MTTWEQFLADNKIGTSDWKGYSAPEQVGIANSFSGLGGTAGYESPSQTGMLDGLGNYLGNQKLGDIVDGAGLALGAYDKFFGPGKDLTKLQLATGRENLDTLRQAKADTEKFNKQWADASKTASGLASSVV